MQKNSKTDIPIFRPFELFSLSFLELMVACNDFFLARCCKRTDLTEVLLFSTSNVYFLFAKDTVQKGTFRKGRNLYSKIAIDCPQGSGTLRKQYPRVCQSMPENVRVCQSMPEYARVCKSMPEYARVCQSMP